MNEYLNIERLEFIVTKNCTGKCKHCSVISRDENFDNSYADFHKVVATVKFLLENFNIRSIMTFGGEPLIYSEITAKIHDIAKKYGVAKRELITNGYFSTEEKQISSVAVKILESGVNKILLSVDAFHQEHIPLQYVEIFIRNILSLGFKNLKIHPAWVVSREFKNEYNEKTTELIKGLRKYNIEVSEGNNIVLSGLAKEYLKSFYEKNNLELSRRCGTAEHTSPLDNVKSIRILPNGNINICRGLIIGNLYNQEIDTITKEYNPYKDEIMALLLDSGIIGLYQLSKKTTKRINLDEYYNSCDLCADCIKAINSFNNKESEDVL